MSPARILSQTWVRVVGSVLLGPFCVGCSCLLGLPLAYLVDWIIRGQLQCAIGRPVDVDVGPRRIGGALVLIVSFAASAIVTLIANGIAYRTVGESVPALLGWALPLTFVLGVVAWPIAFVPLAAMDARQIEGRVLLTALDVAGRVSWTRRVALTLSWCWVFPTLNALIAFDPQVALLAAVALPGLVLPLVSSGFVATYVEHEADVRADHAVPVVRVPNYVHTLLGTAVVSALVLMSAVGYVVATPSPLQGRPIEVVESGQVFSAAPIEIEGTSLTVSPDPRGLRVEAADGGGVGLIPGGSTQRVSYERHPDGFLVIGRSSYTDRFAIVDAQGVRLGDPISARLSASLTLPVGLLMFLAFVMFGLTGILATRLQRANALRDYASADDRAAVGDARLLEATLRMEKPPRVSSGHLTPTAPVELLGAELRLVVPDKGVTVVGPTTGLVAGARVCLVGRFERLSPAARRESHVPWPSAAFLVVGSRSAAVDVMIRRVAKRVALALLVGTVATSAAALVLLLPV